MKMKSSFILNGALLLSSLGFGGYALLDHHKEEKDILRNDINKNNNELTIVDSKISKTIDSLYQASFRRFSSHAESIDYLVPMDVVFNKFVPADVKSKYDQEKETFLNSRTERLKRAGIAEDRTEYEQDRLFYRNLVSGYTYVAQMDIDVLDAPISDEQQYILNVIQPYRVKTKEQEKIIRDAEENPTMDYSPGNVLENVSPGQPSLGNDAFSYLHVGRIVHNEVAADGKIIRKNVAESTIDSAEIENMNVDRLDRNPVVQDLKGKEFSLYKEVTKDEDKIQAMELSDDTKNLASGSAALILMSFSIASIAKSSKKKREAKQKAPTL